MLVNTVKIWTEEPQCWNCTSAAWGNIWPEAGAPRVAPQVLGQRPAVLPQLLLERTSRSDVIKVESMQEGNIFHETSIVLAASHKNNETLS